MHPLQRRLQYRPWARTLPDVATRWRARPRLASVLGCGTWRLRPAGRRGNGGRGAGVGCCDRVGGPSALAPRECCPPAHCGVAVKAGGETHWVPVSFQADCYGRLGPAPTGAEVGLVPRPPGVLQREPFLRPGGPWAGSSQPHPAATPGKEGEGDLSIGPEFNPLVFLPCSAVPVCHCRPSSPRGRDLNLNQVCNLHGASQSRAYSRCSAQQQCLLFVWGFSL